MNACWQLLGISPTTNKRRINRAYRARARRCHPDCGGSHDAMLALQNARDTALSWEPIVEHEEPPGVHSVYAQRRISTYEVSEGFLRRIADWRAHVGVGLMIGSLPFFLFKDWTLNLPMLSSGVFLVVWFWWRHRDYPCSVRKGPDVEI